MNNKSDKQILTIPENPILDMNNPFYKRQSIHPSNPSAPHHDIGETLPHDRVKHNHHILRTMINVIDAPSHVLNVFKQKTKNKTSPQGDIVLNVPPTHPPVPEKRKKGEKYFVNSHIYVLNDVIYRIEANDMITRIGKVPKKTEKPKFYGVDTIADLK